MNALTLAPSSSDMKEIVNEERQTTLHERFPDAERFYR